MYRVDLQLIRMIGLDSGSLEDWDWRGDYDLGLLPAQAVYDYMDFHGLLSPAKAITPLGGEASPNDGISDDLEEFSN